MRKYYLRKIFFLMLKNSVLSKFTSMQDLENNNWIILGPLGSIEIQNYINFIITLLSQKGFMKTGSVNFPALIRDRDNKD